jgi:hypothetical protein
MYDVFENFFVEKIPPPFNGDPFAKGIKEEEKRKLRAEFSP